MAHGVEKKDHFFSVHAWQAVPQDPTQPRRCTGDTVYHIASAAENW